MGNYIQLIDKDKFFDCTTINDWKQFEDLLINGLARNSDLRYRSVKEAKYQILSSAYRHYVDGTGCFRKTVDDKMGKNCSLDEFVLYYLETAKANSKLTDYFQQHTIVINDFLILALLQHFGYPSPLIDFSYDFYHSLFFALPEQIDEKYQNVNGIDDYFSVYALDGSDPYFSNSIQTMVAQGANRANSLIEEFGERIDTSDFEKETTQLSYQKFAELPFFPVDGPLKGVFAVQMPAVGFETELVVDNPRIDFQQGLFICIPSPNSLEEQITKNKPFTKILCYNIHKSLLPKIKELLDSKGITRQSIYQDANNDAAFLKDVLGNTFN